MSRTVIALLGRRDEPTDAVEEYCRYLGGALESHDIQLEIRRVPWEIHGWDQALKTLPLIAEQWRGKWVLVQYTALIWSARGFPRKFLKVLEILKRADARLAVVFHDVLPFSSSRWIDRLRCYEQTRVMTDAARAAELAIFTVSLEKLPWLPPEMPNARFIPVGPNLPISDAGGDESRDARRVPTVGVFSITGGDNGKREVQTICEALRVASLKLGALRLLVFGRNAELFENDLRQGLRGHPVEISVEGVLPAEEIVKRLQESDLLLFVRGAISTRRGSAIAGIACGLPVLAYEGVETAAPITEAGVVLVPANDADQLNAALLRILSDKEYCVSLGVRSRAMYHSHFSWRAIAARLAEILVLK